MFGRTLGIYLHANPIGTGSERHGVQSIGAESKRPWSEIELVENAGSAI